MPEIKENRPKLKRKLTLKQQLFIDNYVNKDNPKTFSNGTQSVMEAYNYDNKNMSAVQANNLLSNSNVVDSIQQYIDDLGMGSKVRLKSINQVITGKHLKTTSTITTDTEGKKYKSITTTSPSASETLKAVDLVEKITGTYDKNKAKADIITEELKGLIRKQRAALTGKARGGGSDAPCDT